MVAMQQPWPSPFVPAQRFTTPGANSRAAANAKGVWTYGYLDAGPSPKIATFKAFDRVVDWQSPKKSPRGFVPSAIPNRANGKTRSAICTLTNAFRTRPELFRNCVLSRGAPIRCFISEYGVGSGVDLSKTTRHFEQLGAEQLEDAKWYRQRLDQFMVDWKRWNMTDTFASPEDFFCVVSGENGATTPPGTQCHTGESQGDRPQYDRHRRSGQLRRGTLYDLPRSEARHDRLRFGTVGPRCVGACSSSRSADTARSRFDLKRFWPMRDMLKPGKYPVRLQVVGPDAKNVLQRTLEITIPDSHATPEPPMAMKVFSVLHHH